MNNEEIKYNVSSPLVSVVLPVYNGALYLKESIESILNQTYSNFEFIILNDGSKDNSEEVILTFNDERIKYHKHSNIGLAATLNVGLKLAKGKYIARQDQDDISHLTRLQKQIDFLENNTSIILLGTRAKIFSDNGTINDVHKHAILPAVLKFDLLFDNYFVHSSVMFNANIINAVGLYNTSNAIYEDFEYWSRFSTKGALANLPETLVDYRHHDLGLSKNISYFKDGALYEQSLLNIETLMSEKKSVYNDLAALYHWKNDKYLGSSLHELKKALNDIAIKIIEIYPNDIALINNRLLQYHKIIQYRINIKKRNECDKNYFKLFLLKVENKIFKLHSNLIN